MEPWNMHHITPQPCPYCDRMNDAGTNMNNQKPPKPGDWSLCYTCAQVSVFDENILMRKLNPAEEVELREDHPEILRVIGRLQQSKFGPLL